MISVENKATAQKQIERFELSKLWERAVNDKNAIAIWRLPREENIHFLADFSGKPKPIKIDFENTDSGFCLSPFLNNDNSETLFFAKDLHFILNQKAEIENFDTLNLVEKQFLEKCKLINFSEIVPAENTIINPRNKKGKAEFEALVNKAIEEITARNFQKVVLSRFKKIEFTHSIHITSVIENLAKKYPKAFISAIYLPENCEIWIGASPELLVSLDENKIFRTMSLAGTQSATDILGNTVAANNARWSQKEIEEQAFVSRYIIECFKKVRVREYIENGPKTVEAGNLLHLQTEYIVDTKAIEFNQFATVMLELLHPTSAVCGMPKEASMAFISENENYNREYYSGFIGPVNIDFKSSLFVNLRSLKIIANEAILFAGAGITEDSIPENEWNETELKMDTLLNVI